MSKRRDSSPDMPRYLKSTISQQKNPQNSKLTHRHCSFIQRTRNRTIKTQASFQGDDKLQTLFHKNISKYRELINSNDKSVLPFISSLRQHSQNTTAKINTNIKTHLEPFAVADKSTCNQKVQKDMNDIKGRTKRISNALYRWHNQTGLGTKNSCFFESKLRETSMKFHNKDTFMNLFHPIQKKLIQQKTYKPHELICSKQKRLFTIQN